MDHILQKLKELKCYNVCAIKQSFEDEGVMPEHVLLMRYITQKCGLDLNIKIGGCEAKTDIDFCKKNNIDSIVAPMIESEFALQKFLGSINKSTQKHYVNIETKNAIYNLDSIVSNPEAKKLFGFVVGRGDLVNSYGLERSIIDTPYINEVVKSALISIKKHNFETIIGGGLTKYSGDFVREMYYDGLLNKIETRNVVIKLGDNNIEMIDNIISQCVLFEIMWHEYNLDKTNLEGSKYTERINTLKKRT